MSWFRNLSIYRLGTGREELTAAALNPMLAAFAFQPCGDFDESSVGFVPPVSHGELAHSVAGRHVFIALRIDKKAIPKTAIDNNVRQAVADIEEKQGFKPGRKQMKEIRETVLDEMLPKSWTKTSTVRAWLDPVGGWFVIDSGSSPRCDELIRIMFKAVSPSFPLESLYVNVSPTSAMTAWLHDDEAPAGFSVDDRTELMSDTRATVRYMRHSLDVDDIGNHIRGGKRCTQLAMTWADRISFLLTADLTLKQVVPLDVIRETDNQNAEERADADLLLMAGELCKLFDDMVAALGGEADK